LNTQQLPPQPQIPSQVLELAEGIGGFIEYWGFKEIHGRIWALIFLTESPVDANYLIQHLSVSKSLVSMSVKDLLDYRVILESSPKKSTVHYEANPDISGVIADVLLAREAKMLLSIKNSCELVRRVPKEKRSDFVSEKRIKKLEQMVSAADKALKTLITFKQLNFKELSDILSLNGKSG
jgi:DNA-binding transcriptional regulator GbsR (MarR family)